MGCGGVRTDTGPTGRGRGLCAGSWGCRPTALVDSRCRLERTPQGVLVHGEIDLDTARPLSEELHQAARAAVDGTFLIDLSNVTFMDSSGVVTLMQAVDLLGKKHIVIRSSRQVFTLLEIVGFTDGWLSQVEVLPPSDG